MVGLDRVENGRVAVVTLNRPDKLNAINSALEGELHRALEELAGDEKVRVGILRGAGRAFCVGMDLGTSESTISDEGRTVWSDRGRVKRISELLHHVWSFPLPLVAQVHGHCIAAGVLLAGCCDLTVATVDCQIGIPRLPLGGGFLGPPLASIVGIKRAKELEYSPGRRIDGRTAAAWGWANYAVEADEVDAFTLQLARDIARVPRSVLELKKAAMNRAAESTGFTDTLLAGAEWDAMAHFDVNVIRIRSVVREEGLDAAIARFEQGEF